MPRPKKPGAAEPKKRSRNGCWPCKARKVKCDEGHPVCLNCQRYGESCDYSIRLNWAGRRTKRPGFETISFDASSSSTSNPEDPLFSPITTSQPTATTANGWSNLTAASPGSVTSSSTGTYGSPTYSTFSTGRALLSPSQADGHPPEPPEPRPETHGLIGPLLLGAFQELVEESRNGDAVSPPAAKRPRTGSSPSVVDENAMLPPTYLVQQILPSLSVAKAQSQDDEAQNPPSAKLKIARPAPDFRRLSVNSLLSGPLESPHSQDEDFSELTAHRSQSCSKDEHLQSTTYYGIDRGFRDLDIGKNDDVNAISGSSPGVLKSHASFESLDDEETRFEFGFGIGSSDSGGGTGSYYDKPVVVRIPHSLEPLPSKLRDNPMNLLYFHHFLNHTARVLVPHDDLQSNPFRTILPQMAVKNDNLLSLLLAYSASHRARHLQQPEPATRIALWVQDIFPALRHALDDPTKKISNANVATAIMLASLEIISPTAFGYSIPWQRHLILARELITARPEGLRVEHHSSQEGQVCSFLWSWFAYLDVLGSLSGGLRDASPVWILDYKVYDPDDDDEIDCIMGFTTRCIYILAKIAELARRCDAERIGADGAVCRDWEPASETREKAVELERDVRESMAWPPRACAHIHRLGDVKRWDRGEMTATNEAYHWAALVHLHRRVLGKASGHGDVQEAVGNVIRCLDRVRRGGTAEGCLLFPMFTAGCDTTDTALREDILERMRTVESTGMTQVNKARRLMQMVWDTGQPWETLLSTEFIG